MMLQGFPSVQSGITAETVAAYLAAVEDVSLEALQRACRAFAKGIVKGFNNDFAPAAARLAQEARKYDEAMAALEAARNAPRLVRYGLGEQPPPGYEPVPFIESGNSSGGFERLSPRITVGDPDGNTDAGEAA